MQNISAQNAKARFGQLLDSARREPVTIEKHGRPVAVLVSKEDFDESEKLKLERLQAEVKIGIAASQTGDSVEIEQSDLEAFVENIMTGID